MGIDPTKTDFWQSSFDVYAELVDKYIEMTNTKKTASKKTSNKKAEAKGCKAKCSPKK